MTEREIANDLLTNHWSGRGLPVDPAEIARAAGIQVKPFAPSDYATASGWYRQESTGPAIYFNPTEVEVRRRFTIAHELGHHALGHGPRPRDSAAEFNLLNYDPMESSANRFAAELLMPSSWVRREVEGRGTASLSALASQFAVSEVAMKIRLQTLGLL